MSVNILYYKKANGRCPVQEFIDNLSGIARARTFKTFDLFEDFGIFLGMPHVKKIAGTKAWELRVKTDNVVLRYYFCMRKKDAIIFHYLKKKTNEIPNKDLEIINKMIKEIL